ncbi:MAG: MraY family glycosyltransferase [Planctomycetota bacterium]|nr:MraY family glycosyltransferase [Planctomycetota bacterium]
MAYGDLTFVDILQPTFWYGLFAFAVSLVATPICRFIAYKTGIVDRPDDLLKPHGRPVAYLGGIGICLGLLVGLCSYIATMENLDKHWESIRYALGNLDFMLLIENPLWNLFGIGLAFVAITLVGLLDDILSLSPRTKILGQVLAAGLLLVGGVGIEMGRTFVSFGPGSWLLFLVSSVLCLFTVVITCNAVNLLDGMDGLCGGVTGIIAIAFLVLSTWLATFNNNPSPHIDLIRVVVCLAMVGGVAGFLPYNVPPATIFMGDAGSMLLGFFVATTIFLFGEQGNIRWILGSLVVFALPLLDTSLAVVRRLLSGKNIFTGDRSHLYDQLVDRGWPVKKVVVLFYAMAAVSGTLGVLTAVYVRTRYAVIIYALCLIAVWIVFWKLGMIRPEPRKPLRQAPQDPH